MRTEIVKFNKLNNKGASLITVIIAIMFISILATTFLFIAGANFSVKANDKHNKESFYETETAAEEIKAELALECAKAAEKAYMDVIIKYNVTTANKRYETYRDAFFNECKRIWENDLLTDYGVSTYTDVLQAMVDTGATVTIGDDAFYFDIATDPNHAYIRDILISFTNADGYTSEILTDIVFTTPKMNWGIDASYTAIDPSLEDKVDERIDYDISDCVNYANWIKQ